MKATLVFLALVACSITQVDAAPTGSAAAVVVLGASSASAAKSKAIAATSAKSDCGACHQEVFPFTDVKKEGMFHLICHLEKLYQQEFLLSHHLLLPLKQGHKQSL